MITYLKDNSQMNHFKCPKRFLIHFKKNKRYTSLKRSHICIFKTHICYYGFCLYLYFVQINRLSVSVSASIKADVLSLCWSGEFSNVLMQKKKRSKKTSTTVTPHLGLGDKAIYKQFEVYHCKIFEVRNIKNSCQSSQEGTFLQSQSQTL